MFPPPDFWSFFFFHVRTEHLQFTAAVAFRIKSSVFSIKTNSANKALTVRQWTPSVNFTYFVRGNCVTLLFGASAVCAPVEVRAFAFAHTCVCWHLCQRREARRTRDKLCEIISAELLFSQSALVRLSSVFASISFPRSPPAWMDDVLMIVQMRAATALWLWVN